MNSNTSSIQTVSDTAYWVAFYRATESRREDALFRDPLAELLIGEHGKKVSNSMKSIGPYVYWSVTIRTCVIDGYIQKYAAQGYTTLINLGAGLDTRPYRLALPQDFHWIEIDVPEIIEMKNERLQDHPPQCQLERITLNLSNQTEREKLFAELNHRVGPALVLTEGVTPYLDEASMRGLAHDLQSQSNFQLWINEYYSPEVYPRFQSQQHKTLMGNSPFQFFPSDWFSFFEECGWTRKEMKYLCDEASQRHRGFPLPRWVTWLKWILGQDNMMKRIRTFTAYTVLEKI